MTAWLLFLVGLIMVYARWWSWYGGMFWGPRLLLFASIPAAFCLASWLQTRSASLGDYAAGMACLLWSVWVGIDGAVYGLWDVGLCSADQYALEFLCWYTPEFSPLFRPFFVEQPIGTPAALLTLTFLAAGVSLAARHIAGRAISPSGNRPAPTRSA